jgi:hypothetical protein
MVKDGHKDDEDDQKGNTLSEIHLKKRPIVAEMYQISCERFCYIFHSFKERF